MSSDLDLLMKQLLTEHPFHSIRTAIVDLLKEEGKLKHAEIVSGIFYKYRPMNHRGFYTRIAYSSVWLEYYTDGGHLWWSYPCDSPGDCLILLDTLLKEGATLRDWEQADSELNSLV